MLRRLIFLTDLRRFEDVGLLVLRVFTGAFLIYGTWDNVASSERMAEFEGFLTQFGFVAPAVMAPLSVYAQFVCGLLLIVGLFTRWSGWIIAFNFAVAIAMVDRLSPSGLRGVWPAEALLLIGLYLGVRGAGLLSVDARLEQRRRAGGLA